MVALSLASRCPHSDAALLDRARTEFAPCEAGHGPWSIYLRDTYGSAPDAIPVSQRSVQHLHPRAAMIIPRWILVLAACASCSRPASGDNAPQPQRSEPPRFEKPAMVAFHMRAHLGDLRDIERLLIVGKLGEAKVRAFLLTKPAPDPGMARWQREVDDVTNAARALAAASSVDDALRREVRVAAACAGCHTRVQKLPVFAEPAAPPADDGKPPARMARHQWAVNRLWEGMVGGSDHHWRLGVEVLAKSPLPFSSLTDAPALAARLQSYAQHELANQTSESLEERARVYGEMLVTCAACHLERK